MSASVDHLSIRRAEAPNCCQRRDRPRRRRAIEKRYELTPLHYIPGLSTNTP
jgi:hypothetical protein